MKPTLKKIIILSAILTMIFSAGIALAQTKDYTVLAPLPGTTSCGTASGANCTTNFATYLPGLFTFLLGLATFMAFVMITWGGIQYATSDAITGKANGRENIDNALWGLGLVIGAWIILFTINPQILKFDLSLPQPNKAINNGTTGTTVAVSVNPCTVSNCTPVNQLGIPANADALNGYVTPTLAVKLKALNNTINGDNIGGWHISEATGALAVVHSDQCHSDGSCVDANINTTTNDNIKTFFNAAAQNGFDASYEVKTQTRLSALQAAGFTISQTCAGKGTVCLNTGATAEHFHIK